jgi:hypothetical protein
MLQSIGWVLLLRDGRICPLDAHLNPLCRTFYFYKQQRFLLLVAKPPNLGFKDWAIGDNFDNVARLQVPALTQRH